MTAVEEARTRLKSRRRTRQEEPWRPPVLADLLPFRPTLAFDATLTHCGWALIEVAPSQVVVYDKGCINPATVLNGYMGTWDKARTLKSEIDTVQIRFPDAWCVVEAPAVHGNRTESSLIAGMLTWLRDPAHTSVVSATHVSAVLLGEHQVRSDERKKRVREAVIGLVPEAAGRDWNEHIRDAVATGLTDLFDEKKRRDRER